MLDSKEEEHIIRKKENWTGKGEGSSGLAEGGGFECQAEDLGVREIKQPLKTSEEASGNAKTLFEKKYLITFL